MDSKRHYLDLVMDLRINKQTVGVVTNETRLQDKVARVILLAENRGLNCKNEREMEKSNHERKQYETETQGALKTEILSMKKREKSQNTELHYKGLSSTSCFRERSRRGGTGILSRAKRRLGVPCLLMLHQ